MFDFKQVGDPSKKKRIGILFLKNEESVQKGVFMYKLFILTIL